MNSSSRKVELYFHRTAHQFHVLYREERNWKYHVNQILRPALYERVRITLDELQKLPNASVLDVGCGSGRNSVLFSKQGADRVVGVDFAPAMIALARNHNSLQGLQNPCEFVQGDVLTYDFAATFDASWLWEYLIT